MPVYLLYGIIVSASAVAAACCFPRHRRIALISGLVAAPLGLLDALFTVDYWSPQHVFGRFFSIEGVLFSFGNAVFLWLIVAVPISSRVTFGAPARTMARVIASYIAFGLAVMFALWERTFGLTGANLMTSALIAIVATAGLMFVRRPDLAVIPALGAIGFGAFYTLQMALLSWIDPSLAAVWFADVRAGPVLFGFPIEEYLWAVAYGSAWSLGMAVACDVRFVDKEGTVRA